VGDLNVHAVKVNEPQNFKIVIDLLKNADLIVDAA
jgi:hypothetical protein